MPKKEETKEAKLRQRQCAPQEGRKLPQNRKAAPATAGAAKQIKAASGQKDDARDDEGGNRGEGNEGGKQVGKTLPLFTEPDEARDKGDQLRDKTLQQEQDPRQRAEDDADPRKDESAAAGALKKTFAVVCQIPHPVKTARHDGNADDMQKRIGEPFGAACRTDSQDMADKMKQISHILSSL